MWTYTDSFDTLPNLIVRSNFLDGVLEFFQIYPIEGYALRITVLDEYLTDDEGNYIFDENGERVLENPWRSYGGATALPDYDWKQNPDGFCAEIYEESMEVSGTIADNAAIQKATTETDGIKS